MRYVSFVFYWSTFNFYKHTEDRCWSRSPGSLLRTILEICPITTIILIYLKHNGESTEGYSMWNISKSQEMDGTSENED